MRGGDLNETFKPLIYGLRLITVFLTFKIHFEELKPRVSCSFLWKIDEATVFVGDYISIFPLETYFEFIRTWKKKGNWKLFALSTFSSSRSSSSEAITVQSLKMLKRFYLLDGRSTRILWMEFLLCEFSDLISFKIKFSNWKSI